MTGRRQTQADFDYFVLEIRTPSFGEFAECVRIALAELADEPPLWVDASWKPSMQVGSERTPRSKPRVSSAEGVSAAKVDRLLARPRTTRLSGVSLTWTPPAHTADRAIPWTQISAHDYIGTTMLAARVLCPIEIRSEPSFGPELFRVACHLLAAAGQVTRGGGWFGLYDVDPFLINAGRPPSETAIGYPYLGIFTPEQVHLLGGVEAFGAAPVAHWEPVTTRADETCVVTVLADTPETVDDEHLQAWREYLDPVIDSERVALRQETFRRLGDPHDVRWDRPPLILDKDWPANTNSSLR